MSLRRVFVVVVLLAGACSPQRPTLQTDGQLARLVDSSAVVDGVPSSAVSEISGDVTLRMAVDGTWVGDPADAGPASLPNRVLAGLLFEGLTRRGSSGVPEPALAVRWEVSADRLSWEFILPVELTDGDGSRIKAEDVVNSLDHVAARGPSDQVSTALVAVTGWEARMAGASDRVSGIHAVDDTTVRIELDSPFELILEVLASPAFGIAINDDDGFFGTTGDYRRTEDPLRLVAVDSAMPVGRIDLVPVGEDLMSNLGNGLVDWAVVPQGAVVDGLPGDLIRQPLDMRVVMVFRIPDMEERLGLSQLIDSVSVASGIQGLSAIGSLPVDGSTKLPDSVVMDIPSGHLGTVAEETASQFEAAGVAVEWVDSSSEEFARRVTSGEAVVFPMLVAGGTGVGGATMRFFAVGGVDDVIGDSSPLREQLSDTAASEMDPVVRVEHMSALEQHLIREGLVRIVGQYEATVAIGSRLRGLRQLGDGTLDLSDVVRSAEG